MIEVPGAPAVDFRAVFEAAPHPYLLLAPDSPRFTILAVDDAYLAATGTVREEILGRGLFEVFPDNPGDADASGVSDLRASLDRVLRDRQPDVMGVQKYDIPLTDGSGGFEVRYWSPVNSPVLTAGAVSYLIHRVEDVTEFILARERASARIESGSERTEAEVLRSGAELKEANRALKALGEQLADANARLTDLDRVKTEFFSNVSHEFRTPLTLLLGPIERLLDPDSAALAPEQRRLLQTAHRNARRLLRLVNNLLDFSSLEAGRQAAAFAPTDLAGLTAELASNFHSACEDAGLALVVDCPPLPHPVHVDRRLWEKVVLNLVANACKYTKAGSITVEVRPSGDGAAAELSVRDTGVGIPEEELPRIFERFHRVRGAAGRSIEGAGIGLSLVQQVVALHGGEITVASELGRGSTFTVTIPFGEAHLPAEQVVAAGEAAARPAAPLSLDEPPAWLTSATDDVAPAAAPTSELSARIVLADDNADMRAYVGALLRAAGHDVTETCDGAAALAETRLQSPDLVIADVMMPELDGFGLAAALRADVRTAGVPLILLSARAGEDARVEGLAAGADDYLVKPFSARELVARVEGGLRLTRLRRDLEGQLRQVQKMEAVSQLTGGIAHDFNNLLTAILGGLDLIVKRTDDERLRRLAANALAASERGAKLAGQLLAFSRIQRLQIAVTDLQAILSETRDALARTVGPGVALDISVDRAARFAMADAAQVEVALMNLAANARAAMPDGGRLDIAVTHAAVADDPQLPTGRYAVISVTDTGEGMTPEVAARAFDPFFSTRGVGRGAGLGLSQVYATAQKCGGVARIDSTPGAGTTVLICLPVAQAEEAARPSVVEARGGGRPHEGACVLIIDDDELVRRLFVDGLREFGYRVAEAADGRAGLELLDRERPDVMVVDYAMPGMNGGEVARVARARRPDLPILFATGFADSDDLALVPGAVVLTKPLTLFALAAALDRALAAPDAAAAAT